MVDEAPHERCYYVDDYTDEVLPCAATLEAWAAWLAGPDETWSRAAPAADGALFKVSSLDILGDVVVTVSQGVWSFPPPPLGATYFYMRHDQGLGWDAEFSGETVADAVNPGIGFDVSDGIYYVAATREGPQEFYRFDASSPALVRMGPVQ